MKNEAILLVEDNPDDAELIQIALKENNISNKVILVTDGAQALDYLFGTGTYAGRDTNDLPTVILLDLKLPKVNGFEVLKKLRSEDSTRLLPVVILTSSKEDQDIVKSYELGASSYVSKPIEFTEFTQAVGQLGLYWLLLNRTAHQTWRD